MKKHFFVILILLICSCFILYNIPKQELYKVIEIKSTDSLCIDFNYNEICDKDEIIKPYGITIFPEKFGKTTQYLEQKYSIKERDSVVLGVLGKKFLEENLLNKNVEVEILNNTNNKYTLAKIFLDGNDFSQIILKKGFALSDNNEDYKNYEDFSAIKKNISHSHNFNYQLRNKKNGKIHTLDCEYGRKAKNYEIGIFDEEQYKKDYSKDCHKQVKTASSKIPAKNFDYISDNIKVYFLDFTHTLKPDTSCSTPACKILLENINNSKESIDFAIYGLGNIPKIETALKNASERGVKVRYIVDEDSDNNNIYERTEYLKSSLKNFKTDFNKNESSRFNNFIMHNKFFIFDKKYIWLGSANISETDLSGFSANNVIFIKSNALAQIYTKEFENMYSEHFHTRKTTSSSQEITVDNTNIKVFFSPQDNTISNYIIPVIDKAQKSILIETFILTHKALAESLIKAKGRGVEIKIIVDATSVSNSYSQIKYLRQNGIEVKTENYAGKMHMKTLIVDDDDFISGSMNFTKNGEKYNDENMIFIKNKDINKQGKEFFKYIWKQIPDKYLNQNPKAESKASIGSCSDGIDNDYDGDTDNKDNSCN